MLTPQQRDQFHRDGYLIIPGFVSPEDVAVLLDRSKSLLQEFSLEGHPLTKFTTGDDDGEGHIGDNYFLNSGNTMLVLILAARYFLEEDAVVDGKLTRPKELAVNKIGHGLHELDPAFRKVTLENDRMRALVRDLQFHRDPVVGEHNDSALGFWIALEECTASNGALSFLPGSHLTTPITKRFVRLPTGGTGFEPLVAPEVAEQVALQSKASRDSYILETCKPGDLVLIHGSVLHKSERNTSDKTRFAYTFHMIESSGAKYDEKNWLQPTPGMPFSRILA
ncbi:phytanoyl-CoA dioxygenase [Mycena leptocephala]|nr:phytanoyl-CoA dioxygenase [Mycena leptocephala]